MPSKISLAFLLGMGVLAAPAAQAGVNPFAILGTLNQIQTWSRRLHKQLPRLKKLHPAYRFDPDLAPVFEKMRSPFQEDRFEASKEIVALAQESKARESEFPERERTEVLLSQLLRDGYWKTRMNAYKAMTELSMLEPIEDKAERFQLLFPKKVPERTEAGTEVQGPTLPTELALLADLLQALQKKGLPARTKIAKVLDDILEEPEPGSEIGGIGGALLRQLPGGVPATDL